MMDEYLYEIRLESEIAELNRSKENIERFFEWYNTEPNESEYEVYLQAS